MVDDHAIVRKGLQQILKENPHIEVSGEATNGEEALEKIINNDFQDILKSWKDPKFHIFFDSHEWYLKTFGGEKPLGDYTKKLIKGIESETNKYDFNNNLDLEDIQPVKDCSYIPEKVISHEMLIDNYKLLTEETDFNKIRNKLDAMRDYNLPSTIEDFPTYLKLRVLR